MTRCWEKKKTNFQHLKAVGGGAKPGQVCSGLRPGENALQCCDVCERSWPKKWTHLTPGWKSAPIFCHAASVFPVLGHTHLGALANVFYLHWQQMKRLPLQQQPHHHQQQPPQQYRLWLRVLTILVINICVMDFFIFRVSFLVCLCGSFCLWLPSGKHTK